MSEDTTPETLPGGEPNVPPSGGQEAVTSGETSLSGVRDVIKTITGKDFPTDEAAIKSVKDTYKYVGSEQAKVGSKIKQLSERFKTDENGLIKLMENVLNAPETPSSAVAPAATQQPGISEMDALMKEVQEVKFFDEHPEYKDHRKEITALRDLTKKSIRDVVEDPTLKGLLEKAKTADSTERTRSALHSTPELGSVRDKMTEARAALSSGNDSLAKQTAVGSVIDTFLK